MLGISTPDFIVLITYFLGITAIGIWAYKKIKTSNDYFMGNRRFGKLLMIAQAFGVGTHTDQPVTVAGASYTTGLAGIWYQWIYMFATPFFWIIAPIYRRLRYVTMADFFHNRYGKSLGIFYTIIGTTYFCMNMGLMLKGTGITIEGITDGAVKEHYTILFATVLFVIYGFAGGLIAATVTDLIQGILILVLSFLIIPFAIKAVGDMSLLSNGLPDYMFSLVAPYEITAFFIIMAVINALVGIVIQPHHMAIGGAGKSEIASRMGWTIGTFLKRFATIGWAFTGIFAAFLFPGLVMENRELAFGIAARNLLPVGLVGLMLAALIAAVMSTCDAFMVHASALFTRNLYLPYINPEASDKQLLRIGRYSSIIIVAGGISFAFLFPSVVQGLIEIWKVTAYLGLAFWFGIIWKKANRYGAWTSAVTMAVLSIYTGNFLNWPLPNQILLYLPVGIVVFIVISLLTKPESSEQLRQFYMLLDTPVGKESRLRESNVDVILEGVSIGVQKKAKKMSKIEKFFTSKEDEGLLLVDLLSLGKKFSWQRYKNDILGFSFASLLVFLIILFVMFLAELVKG